MNAAVLGSGTTDENLYALTESQTTATALPLYVPQGTAANTAQITPDGSTGATVQYAVAATHSSWTSNVSSVALYTPGFDAGGWQ